MRGTPVPLHGDAGVTVHAGHTGHGFHCWWPRASQHHRLGGCGRGEADPRSGRSRPFLNVTTERLLVRFSIIFYPSWVSPSAALISDLTPHRLARPDVSVYLTWFEVLANVFSSTLLLLHLLCLCKPSESFPLATYSVESRAPDQRENHCRSASELLGITQENDMSCNFILNKVISV